jgi:hypothetical protein
MAMKQPGRKTYRTAQGKQIDMDMLRKKNELTPAVGNAKVNARGDELGTGGKIVRRREDIVNEYYKNTNFVPNESTPKKAAPSAATEEKTAKKTTSKKKITAKTKEPEGEIPSASEEAEWEENEAGDFVKKGE